MRLTDFVPFVKEDALEALFRMLTMYILTAGEEIKQFGKKFLPNKEFYNLHRSRLSSRPNRRNKWMDV